MEVLEAEAEAEAAAAEAMATADAADEAVRTENRRIFEGLLAAQVFIYSLCCLVWVVYVCYSAPATEYISLDMGTLLHVPSVWVTA